MGLFSIFHRKDREAKPSLADIFEDPGGDMAYNRQLNEEYYANQHTGPEDPAGDDEPEQPVDYSPDGSESSPGKCVCCGADLDNEGDCPRCGASNYKFGSCGL